MNLDEALQTFIVEARELLEQMEDALLRIEQTPDDAETINAIFRAAHTIKGSAGLFGLDHVVEFTHVAENVLDKVRSGALRIDSDLVVLFLGVCDHLGVLVSGIADGVEPDQAIHDASAELARICVGVLDIPPPRVADETVSARSDTPPFAAVPVAEVVQALAPGAAPIRHLVPVESRVGQPLVE